MQDLKPTIWAGYNLSVEEHHRSEEQMEKNSHILKNQLKRNPFDVLWLLRESRSLTTVC